MSPEFTQIPEIYYLSLHAEEELYNSTTELKCNFMG